MNKKAKIIALANQKGGTAKTTSTINLGVALAKSGFKVLLIDLDSQGSLSTSLGIDNTDSLDLTICDALNAQINDESFDTESIILHHQEGFDYIPANIDLAAMDVHLISVLGRERILSDILQQLRPKYDYILIDCMPSLGMLTINALTAADSVLIPAQAAYLSARGLEQLLKSIAKIRKQLNPKLSIEGILITLVDNRTNYSREIIAKLRESYGEYIRIFDTVIPLSVKASEASASGSSIFSYDPRGKVAQSYLSLSQEVQNEQYWCS